jgi:hypothetical protein
MNETLTITKAEEVESRILTETPNAFGDYVKLQLRMI